jgi:hypothetical protein
MSRTLQFRRYDTATLANTVGADGELIVNTTNKTLTVHDGALPGGYPLLNSATDNNIDQVARNTANSATTLAQNAYNYANTIVSDTQIDPVARATANSAAANTIIIQGVNLTQNTNITNATNLAQAAFNAANTGGGANTGNFTFSGNTMTAPAGGIITSPNDEFFKLQANDTNSLLRNEIKLDPNNGTYMSVWSGELDTSFSTSDWDTASWENLEGVPGISGAFFTNAENLQDFWTTGIGSFVDSVEVSINGGARLPVSYDGNNGETYGALLLVTGVPATSPTTITSLTFYYRTQNKINIDYDGGEILLDAQSMDIDIRTTNNLDLRSSQNLNIRGLGAAYPVRIYTNDNTHIWEFDSTGSLTLPKEGKLYGIGDGPGGDRYGYISWAGNTSGDGAGYNTMRLVPDMQGLESADQYIILDPTSPGHIHIRAGGTQDSSSAELFLGGEDSHVKIGAGFNPPVTIKANTYSWNFDVNGDLAAPGKIYLNNNNQNVLTFDQFGIRANTQMVLSAENFATGNNSSILFDKNGSGIVFRLEDTTPVSKNWGFYQNNLLFPNSSTQTGAAISIVELKALVANCATYGDFQTAIANL